MFTATPKQVFRTGTGVFNFSGKVWKGKSLWVSALAMKIAGRNL